MITITGIKETKRGRFALFDETGFLFSVDDGTLANNDLHEGAVLSEDELAALREQSDTRRAADQALRYLAVRAHAEKELEKKLLLKYDEHSVQAALAKMRELDLLDDEAFAQEKARSLAGKRKSPMFIRRTLTGLGVDRDLAQQAVEALELDEEQAALNVINRYYTDKLRACGRQNVMAALARRGFTHGTVVRAVQQAAEGLDIEPTYTLGDDPEDA